MNVTTEGKDFGLNSVLGLAETELAFFTAASTLLCCRSVAKTVLITPPCFSCCCAVLAQHEGLLFLTLPPQ